MENINKISEDDYVAMCNYISYNSDLGYDKILKWCCNNYPMSTMQAVKKLIDETYDAFDRMGARVESYIIKSPNVPVEEIILHLYISEYPLVEQEIYPPFLKKYLTK